MLAGINKIIIFTALIGILFHHGAGADTETSRLVESHYRFYYQKSDSILVDQLITRIAPSLAELEDFFQEKPHSEVKIILAKSKQEYYNKARVRIPEWSQAIAFTGEGKILLNLSSAEAIQESPAILVHELFHIFLRLYYPRARVPVWINEGLAQHFEKERLGFDEKRQLATALSTGKLIDLMTLDTVLKFGPARARIAYIEALSAVEFFIKQHGLNAMQGILEQLNRGVSQDDAFLNTVGYDFIDFEIRWNEYLSEHYKWLVVLNFDNLLWVSIGFLFIIALILKYIRTRRTIKNWDDEEPYLHEM